MYAPDSVWKTRRSAVLSRRTLRADVAWRKMHSCSGHEAVGEGRSPQAGYHRLSSRPVGGHQGHQLGDVHKALGTYNFMSILCTVGTKGYYNFDMMRQK